MCKENDDSNLVNENKNEEKLLEQYNPLVHKIVNRLNYGYVDKEDLIQAGLLGLLTAIQKYDYSKYDISNSSNFISYASIYIVSSIKEEMRNNKLIVLNKEIIAIIRKIKLMDRFSIEEVSKELNTTKDKVFLAYLYKDRLVSLDKDNSDDENLIDLIEEKKKENLIEHINKLDEKERKLIYGKYFYNQSQTEIAESLNISQSTVSRFESKVLKKLKHLILYSN